MLNKIIKYFLENKLVTLLLLGTMIMWGISTAPFNWGASIIPRNPVPVDAIPDIGENQQIIYTEWNGRSPQDIEDQISYPLTTALLGIPGVKTIRSNSIFGLSSIYLIFEDDVEFYWSRTRILEKLNSLPRNLLPNEVSPALGPDATALGQVYWYTLEGRDQDGNPSGGWDPQELRSIQDFQVSFALTAVKGVSEVGTIGGFVKEYQVDIDPNSMKAHNVTVAQIMKAVKKSNLDIGARTIEYNKVEYLIRGLGYIETLKDLEESVIISNDNVPIRIKDVAKVAFGPATRRGGLDKGGSEAVGGVVVARYGANPLQVIDRVKEKIKEIEAGLPSKTLANGTVSRVRVIPFYDRTSLIKESLGTLEEALTLEMLIALLVVIVLVLNLRASILITSLLPLGILITFIMMSQFGVDANIVALSGIAIAIGVMVDVGVVFTENIIQHIDLPKNIGKRGKELMQVIYEGASEVASAVVTALFTTIISFLPIFAMQAAEGKLFTPLAFTKTFAMLAALFIGIVFIPTFAHIVFSIRFDKGKMSKVWNGLLIIFGFIFLIGFASWLSTALILFGFNNLLEYKWHKTKRKYVNYINILITLFVVVYLITGVWMPLGVQNSFFANWLFVSITVGIILGLLMLMIKYYTRLLIWCLANKWKFLMTPIFIVLFGLVSWQGFDKIFSFFPEFSKKNTTWNKLSETFPGVGKEFMPSLNEGSFLLMPTTMPHSGIEENVNVIRKLDRQLNAIPEVEISVGKWGRVNSALDPAPISMYENVISYFPEFKVNEDGHKMQFKINKKNAFVLKDGSTYKYTVDPFRSIPTKDLIEDNDGAYFRQWREHIQSPDDIWKDILIHAKIPGLTSAPKLQPIETRLVMLATGMRAPMGVKVFGPDLETIEKVGYDIENILKQVPSVEASAVFADRVVGKPYLEIKIDREAIARYGLTIEDMQKVIETAIGGMQLTTTVEGRERFPVRVRYAREYRDNPEDLKKVLIPTPEGVQIPLEELAEMIYVRGPQVIKSEDTFLVSYVIFDKKIGHAEVDVVEDAQALLKQKIEFGEFVLPAGVSYRFTGNYENQVRATKRLILVVPISLLLIFLILYFQFKSVATTSMIFSGLIVAFSGGFIMLWLYSQPEFLNFSIGGINLRDLFQVRTVNLSVAVWVGFIALFGVATDDGVLMGTYLTQLFKKENPDTKDKVRATVLLAASKRVRPAVLTTATTIIALIPVLTSQGKGSDIMGPMAIPLFGGMLIEVMTMFIMPVLYSMWQEGKIKQLNK
ncbi:efflux RND transporter permease subunit [Flavicella sp.]|uniref:efflux RND transporter permease subunit n=1 Tax=Flavicella sp. TaxID=2957742 RepID=UPI003019D8C8